MHKAASYSLKIIFFTIIFISQGTGFIPESHSAKNSSLQKKRMMVEEVVQRREKAGEPLTPELERELQKARGAQRKKDWKTLRKSLSQIIEISSREILAGADERIEKYRKGTGHLTVVTKAGKPVVNAKVKIEQTQHEFLFGMNRSYVMQRIVASKMYGTPIPKFWFKKYHFDDQLIEKYMQSFFEFANYTSLPVAWPVYESSEGKIEYAVYDREIEYLHENGMKILAHSLVWNNNTPKWVPNNCKEITRAVERRVGDFISYYQGKFDFFLIFNEPAQPFRPKVRKDKMTKCFRELGSVGFVSMPFVVSRKIDPRAKLMINEIAVVKNRGFPDLLKRLRDAEGRSLFDVIGIQSHMHSEIWPVAFLWEICEEYASFKLPIHFTEVTVLSGTPISGKSYGMKTTPGGERQQAKHVVDLYTTLFSYPSVEAIQWWNLTDLGAWKRAPAGLLRKDMTPKPAYKALVDLIKRKWWTRVETKSSRQGECEFKGFFGDYNVTVTPGSGSVKTFQINLSKDGQRDFRIVFDSIK